MTEKTYTLREIKTAFWSQFHESGELWFDYLGDDEENEICTNDYWEEFIECLDEI
jgi:hypothetical protein